VATASDISWSGPNGTFNLRVAAVIRRGEQILLCTVDGLDYWFLPGGRVRFGEPSDTALTRELAEELGHDLSVGELAFVAENVFDRDGIQHEIGLYYHVAWPSTLPPEDLRRGSEMGHEFCWMAVSTLGSVRFEPAGLVHVLQDRSDTLEHVVLGRPDA
jgi:ADP-ribose pyrophosphatase YjhB (NUDIX family)